MALTVVAAADNYRMATLEMIKEDLNITGGTEDDELYRVLDQASAFIVKYTGRKFARETVTELLEGTNSPILLLERTPIVTITTITDNGTAIGSTEYFIEDADVGTLFRQVGWRKDKFYHPNTIDLFPTSWAKHNWSVTYCGGFVLPEQSSTDGDDPNLPADLTRICLDLARFHYLNKDADLTVRLERTGDAWITRFGCKESQETEILRCHLRQCKLTSKALHAMPSLGLNLWPLVQDLLNNLR